MSGRISRFCRDLIAVFSPSPAAVPLTDPSPRALLETDEACAQDERTAKEAALMSPSKMIPTHFGARLAQAARELEAALNAYPGDVEVVIDRHRLDKVDGKAAYVFEVHVEERTRLWP